MRNALTKEHVDKNTIKEPCLLTRESESLAPATGCLKFRDPSGLQYLLKSLHYSMTKTNMLRCIKTRDQNAMSPKKICEQDFPSYHGNQSYRLYNQSCFGSPSSLSECVVYENHCTLTACQPLTIKFKLLKKNCESQCWTKC